MLTGEEVLIVLEDAYDSLHSLVGYSEEVDRVSYICMKAISEMLSGNKNNS